MKAIPRPEISIRQYLETNMDSYEDVNDLLRACADTLDVGLKSVKDRYAKVFGPGASSLGKGGGGVKKFKTAIPSEVFRKKLDLVQKVKDALPLLGNDVIWDADFRTELGINATLWKRVIAKPDFDDYRLKVKRDKYIWGKPSVLQKIEDTMDIT